MMSDEPPAVDRSQFSRSQKEHWDETLTLLARRIEQNPSEASSWCSRGFLLKHLRDYEGAARDFKESLRLDPNSVCALRGQGSLYMKLGRYSEAEAMYNKAVALAPEDAKSYSHRGKGYLLQERYDEAIIDLSQAIDLAPAGSMPYFWRAEARQRIKDYGGALSDFESFFRLERECTELIAEAHALRGFLYMELEMYHEAVMDFSATLESAPRDARILMMRASAYLREGNRERATKDRERALEIDPSVMNE
jgi:tetratricopeptide (TPR) repeat protein